MSDISLQNKIDKFGDALTMMRNAQAGPYQFPIPEEFSNWRLEQKAWREGVALMDQSFHMTDLRLEGPDVARFLSYLAINSFDNFGNDKAKQFVVCAPNGYLIGDMIAFGLSDTCAHLVGRPPIANWVQYHHEKGDFDVTCERDERSLQNPNQRKEFRFQIQGPKAWDIIEKLNGSKIDVPRFFKMGSINIAGHTFRTLRHGMGGAPGLEFWGSFEKYDEVKGAILEAGAEFDLRQVGARAYSSSAVDSGWLPCPMAAIYSGDETREYREWLPAASYDGGASLGGSFVSDNIEDYYFRPQDLDYGRLINFDHDFIGKNALQKADNRPRKKVSLVLNPDDAAAVYRSQMTPGENAKGMEAPNSHYAAYPYDAVLNAKGDIVGVSTYCAFIHPDNCWVGLAVVDEEAAVEGTQLKMVWGEPNGGSNRPTVERHVQTQMRATVSGWPFSKVARTGYRPS